MLKCIRLASYLVHTYAPFCYWIRVQYRRYLVTCDIDLAFDHEIDEPAALHLAVVPGHLADSVYTTNIYLRAGYREIASRHL